MSVPDAAPESCFVDTNIWLYAFIEGEDRQKTARAKELLEASRTIISEDIQAGLVVDNRMRIINPFKQMQPPGSQSRI